jgi:hypothetical protein
MFAVEWLVVDDGGDQICDESSICSLHREMIVVRRSRETRGRELFVVRRSRETKGRETESWDKVFWSLYAIQNSLHREMVVVRRSRETESWDKESHVWSLCTIQNVCYDYWVLRRLCIWTLSVCVQQIRTGWSVVTVLCRIACLIVMYDTECLLRLLSFASSMYFGRCRSVFSRLGRVDSLLRWLWNLVMLFVTFKEKSHGRILLARLADRFRSPWKQTSEDWFPDLSSRSALPNRHVP